METPEDLIPAFKLDRVLNQGNELVEAPIMPAADKRQRPKRKTGHLAGKDC